MRRSWMFFALLASFTLPLAAQEADPFEGKIGIGGGSGTGAATATSARAWTRFVEEDGAAHLDTAIRRFSTGRADVEIALVAAVHIADESYYEALTEELAGYDVVLFEGVKGGADVEPDELMTMVGRLQIALKGFLGLSFQPEEMDTSKANFVHADVDAVELKKMLDDAGETLLPNEGMLKMMGPMLEMALKMMQPSDDGDDNPFLRAVRTPLKKQMARMLGDPGMLAAQLGNGDGNVRDTIIIGARNDRALKVLESELRRGVLRSTTEPRRIAIFYGAAHMPDFEEQLDALFDDFKVKKTRWLTAWQLGEPKKKSAKAVAEPKRDTPRARGGRRRI